MMGMVPAQILSTWSPQTVKDPVYCHGQLHLQAEHCHQDQQHRGQRPGLHQGNGESEMGGWRPHDSMGGQRPGLHQGGWRPHGSMGGQRPGLHKGGWRPHGSIGGHRLGLHQGGWRQAGPGHPPGQAGCSTSTSSMGGPIPGLYKTSQIFTNLHKFTW